MQTNLDRWFDVKPVKRRVPNIFYLNWNTDKAYPTQEAVFYEEKPDDLKYNYEYRINWKEYSTPIYIYGLLKKSEDYSFDNIKKPLINDINFLKSQLQKAIRRKKENIAVQTANELIKLDLNSFIRRLPIIMLEDAILNNSFSTLIWIMINLDNKNFKISKNMVRWLLGVVYQITVNEFKYNIKNDINEIVIDKYRSDLLNINSNEYSCLYSILLRKSYGGMTGDCVFLLNRFVFYLDKIKTKNNKFKSIFLQDVRSIEIGIPNMIPDDYLEYAYDFHVNPKIVNYIQNYFMDYSLDYIKKLIWKFSSSINVREILNENKEENNDIKINDWNMIKNKYFGITKYNVNNLIYKKED